MLKSFKLPFLLLMLWYAGGCSSGNKSITSNKMTMDTIKPTKFDNDNLVCMLAPAELAERKEKLQSEIFTKVKTTEEIELGYAFTFEYDEQFIMKMIDYVLAENSCCRFLQFDISLKAKNDVALKITGTSQQAKEMIKIALIHGFE
jgi:hypothetical protein